MEVMLAFFLNSAPSSWQVKINGLDTGQSANSLTFNNGDTVRIEYDSTPAEYFYCPVKDIGVIKGAIPPISDSMNGSFRSCNLVSIPETLFVNNPHIIDFSYCFAYTKIDYIPENLFANNINATNFGNCFEGSNISSIPEKLFANNINAGYFSGCFAGTAISTIPENLFASTINALEFSACFYGTSFLKDFSLRIKSEWVYDATSFVGEFQGSGTIYVPANSATAETFYNASLPNNVTIIEE